MTSEEQPTAAQKYSDADYMAFTLSTGTRPKSPSEPSKSAPPGAGTFATRSPANKTTTSNPASDTGMSEPG